MNTVTVPTKNFKSMKSLGKLENKKFVKLESPIPEGITTHCLEDVIEEGWQKLSDHYGVDMKAIGKSKGYI